MLWLRVAMRTLALVCVALASLAVLGTVAHAAEAGAQSEAEVVAAHYAEAELLEAHEWAAFMGQSEQEAGEEALVELDAEADSEMVSPTPHESSNQRRRRPSQQFFFCLAARRAVTEGTRHSWERTQLPLCLLGCWLSVCTSPSGRIRE